MIDHADRFGALFDLLETRLPSLSATDMSRVCRQIDVDALGLQQLLGIVANSGTSKIARLQNAAAALGVVAEIDRRVSEHDLQRLIAATDAHGICRLTGTSYHWAMPASAFVRGAQTAQLAATLRQYWLRAVPLCARAVLARAVAAACNVAVSAVPVDLLLQFVVPDAAAARRFDFGVATDTFGQLVHAARDGRLAVAAAAAPEGCVDVRFEPASVAPRAPSAAAADARARLDGVAAALCVSTTVLCRRHAALLQLLFGQKHFEHAIALHALELGVAICGSLPALFARLDVLTSDMADNELSSLDVHAALGAVDGEALVGDVDLVVGDGDGDAVTVWTAFLNTLVPAGCRLQQTERAGICSQLLVIDTATDDAIAKVDLSCVQAGSRAALPLAPVLHVKLEAQQGQLSWAPKGVFLGMSIDATKALIAADIIAGRCVLFSDAIERPSKRQVDESLLFRAAKMRRRGWSVQVGQLGAGGVGGAVDFDHLLPAVRVHGMRVVAMDRELAESTIGRFFVGVDLALLLSVLDRLRDSFAAFCAAGSTETPDAEANNDPDAAEAKPDAETLTAKDVAEAEDDLFEPESEPDDGPTTKTARCHARWSQSKKLSILLSVRGRDIIRLRSSLLPMAAVVLPLLQRLQLQLADADHALLVDIDPAAVPSARHARGGVEAIAAVDGAVAGQCAD